MERWRNKTAVITEASLGIGIACSIDLIKEGMKVIAFFKEEDTLEKLMNKYPEEIRDKVHFICCDITDEQDVVRVFKLIKEHFGGVNLLINNAGLVFPTELTIPNNTYEIQKTLDVNVLSAMLCVREAFHQMKDFNDGHIVVLNSVAGHKVPNFPLGSVNIYAAAMHAITAMTETYRQEFSEANSNIKVTSISCGIVNSEIMPARFQDLVDFPMLRPENVVSAILYVVSTPPHVQIHELTVKPLHETF
ncbi:DHRS11.2 family protein [Megaselia abdita]